jgi:diphthine-ammonia ligase
MPFIFISGQIGLIPPSMAVPSPSDVGLEVALSFQHIYRIRTALSTSSLSTFDLCYMGFIIWVSATDHVATIATTVQNLFIEQQHRITDMWKEITETRPPFLFVIPLALPKGASVEIQTVLHMIEHDDGAIGRKPPQCYSRSGEDWQIDAWERDGNTFSIIWLRNSSKRLQVLPEIF